MGFKEAKEDGIEYYRNFDGYPMYKIKCSNPECNNLVQSWSYKRNVKYFCKDCKTIAKATPKEEDVTSKLEKFDKAIDRMRKQKCKIEKYEESISVIRQLLPTKGWFQSTEEMMVAVQLHKDGIKFNHQVKIGRYIVDFVLPDLKVVLEVDGTLYHNKLTVDKERERDDIIILKFGVDWEVIRIKDTYINKNVSKISKAINAMVESRKRIRKDNGNKLPWWYNDHRT